MRTILWLQHTGRIDKSRTQNSFTINITNVCISENLRFEQFCESIRSLFGADIKSSYLKSIYRKISANPDAKVDWSEVSKLRLISVLKHIPVTYRLEHTVSIRVLGPSKYWIDLNSLRCYGAICDNDRLTRYMTFLETTYHSRVVPRIVFNTIVYLNGI